MEGLVSFTRGIKYYELSNHLGNVNSVISDRKKQTTTAGSYIADVKSYVDYYPFGYQMPKRTWQQENYRYGFTGQEKDDEVYGAGSEYAFEYRMLDARLGKFWSVDPLSDDYPSLSPYNYCLNNPLKYVDPDGREPGPGDLFKNVDDAATDFGNYYNGASILRGKELGSSVYKVTVDGKTYYTYTKANEGAASSVKISDPPDGKERDARLHTHGSYQLPSDNDFSNTDKRNSYNEGVDSYVATPNGSLKKYDPSTAKTTTVTKSLPSDSNDPTRANNNNPTDVPMEKTREMNQKERGAKPSLPRMSERQKESYQFTF